MSNGQGREMCSFKWMMDGSSCAVQKDGSNVIEADGEHVTSLRRPDVAHRARLRDGKVRPATDHEFQRLKGFVA